MNGGIIYFLLQAINARTKNVRIFAKDKDIWLSTETGSHFKLDNRTGEIKAGFGGKVKHASQFKTAKVKNGKVQEYHYEIPAQKPKSRFGKTGSNSIGQQQEQKQEKTKKVKAKKLNIGDYLKEQINLDIEKYRDETTRSLIDRPRKGVIGVNWKEIPINERRKIAMLANKYKRFELFDVGLWAKAIYPREDDAQPYRPITTVN